MWLLYPIYSGIQVVVNYRITPFGNPGVNGYVLLTPAYRSLSRPSSPGSSKASAIDLYSLDHIILSASDFTHPGGFLFKLPPSGTRLSQTPSTSPAFLQFPFLPYVFQRTSILLTDRRRKQPCVYTYSRKPSVCLPSLLRKLAYVTSCTHS